MLKFFYRSPDFVITKPAGVYLRRWWVIPRNRFFNIYLHNILMDDEDRALHDHPWASCSIILKGGYVEWLHSVWQPAPSPIPEINPIKALIPMKRRVGNILFRKADAAHRLQLRQNIYGRKIPAWTLFITGPKVRDWGFHCESVWKPWWEFLGIPEGQVERGDETGKGCGE